MTYEFHPLANIFPLIEGKAFEDLTADIAANGVMEPVWLYQGQILDGRNRYRAAAAAGVAFPVRQYEGANPQKFVVSLNLHRRHLSESQRAMVAAKLVNVSNGGDRKSDQSANLQSDSVSKSDAAEMLNVSTRSVASAAKLLQDDAPEEVKEVARFVEAGAVSINLATQFADLPQEVQQRAIASVLENSEPAKEVMREAVKAHVAQNTGNNEWYTPADYIALAREVMGGIDTDPASSEIANRTVQAAQYFTEADNGLLQQWAGRVWMNPPYAQPLIANFADAIASKYESGEIEQACVLINNGTETQWFQRMLQAASAVCFPKSRVRFLDPVGNLGAPLQGQAVIYMGKNSAAFAEAFSPKGTVLFNV